VSKRRLHLDEDTWFAVYSDSRDGTGRLWKFGHAPMYLMPEVPAGQDPAIQWDREVVSRGMAGLNPAMDARYWVAGSPPGHVI